MKPGTPVQPHDELDRRAFIRQGALLLPAAALLGGCGGDEQAASTPTATPAGTEATTLLAPTAACSDDDDPTLELTEGPYFSPGSPLRRSLLEPGLPGDRLTVAGLVLGTDCRPIPRAVLDFWQADADGEYDNEGYRLRGHQRSDSSGRYRLTTVVPGLYPGRTRHIHVKVARPASSRILTTQLFFAGEAGNEQDGIYDPTLVMRMGRRGATRTGRFDFVLA
jgi:protocatechuate 3,4-dioxygenase beta subunit